MALVCQNRFRNCEIPCGMELWMRNQGFSCFYSFATVSQLRIGGSCAAKWHSCAKIGFAAAKIFTEESNELRNDFAKDGRFRRDMLISQWLRLSCEMVSQRSVNFAEDFLRLRSLAEPCFCSVYTLFLVRFCSDFFLSISLHFIPPEIIQKH